MRSYLLGLSALAMMNSVWAATPPLLETSSSPSPYVSSLSDYHAWSEPPVGPWRAANESVQRGKDAHAAPSTPDQPAEAREAREALQKKGDAAPTTPAMPPAGHHH